MTISIKRLSYLTLLLFINVSVLFFLSCSSSDSGTTPEEPQSALKVISSTEAGTISTPSGIQIQVIGGAVPANQSGNSAQVTFSIESPVTPPVLPSNAEVKSNYVKLGPDNFVFRWPVKIIIPFKDASASEVRLIYYNELLGKWRAIPASRIDDASKTIEADVMTLGYFAVAKVTSSFYKSDASDADGGFSNDFEPGYYYTLTVKSVTNIKYSYQAAYCATLPGLTGGNGSYPTGGPKQPTRIHLPQATYEIWITRTLPGTFGSSTIPKVYTYSLPATGTIGQEVTYSGPLTDGSGWTSLTVPGGGNWVEGVPSGTGAWPNPSITYGTGAFQVTLTWANATSTDAADVDLHLFGPNNMHVYYSVKTSSDGSVQLDRDWRKTTGSAVENIYSLATMPRGDYYIRVNLYSGAPKIYSVRVIRFQTVKTFTGQVSIANSSDDPAKMNLIDQFNIP